MQQIFPAAVLRYGMERRERTNPRESGHHPPRVPQNKSLHEAIRCSHGRRKYHRPVAFHRKPHPPRPRGTAVRVTNH
jgi:hypothetical protein